MRPISITLLEGGLIAAVDETVPFAPGHITVALPVLPEAEHCAVWTRVLAEADLGVDTLAARYALRATRSAPAWSGARWKRHGRRWQTR